LFGFTLEKKDNRTDARAGKIITDHGEFETPIFMPVGTQGSVKTVTTHELYDMGADIILGNTYHLHLRPGDDTIKSFKGLHNFISWEKSILTDSGGFQVFSLGEFTKKTQDGVIFKSHLDGSKIYLTPEKCIDIQSNLGSDIMMVLDECAPFTEGKPYIEESLELTRQWALRSKMAKIGTKQSIFGIIQGGVFPDLRKLAVSQITDIGFDGYAIGGLSVGESINQMYELANFTADLLPENKPRYLMGVGTPEDLLNCISFGIDMFDCVMPTRNARNGLLFTSSGKLHIKRKEWALSDIPIDSKCDCYTCAHYSRGYLRHLYKVGELLALRLNTIHNLFFYISLVKNAKRAIKDGYFRKFMNDKLYEMNTGGNHV